MFLLISAGISLLLVLVSLVFRVAGKLRLGIPLLYVAVMGFVFPEWAAAHELLANTILGVLLGLVVVSWGVTLYRKIRNWRDDRWMDRMLSNQIERAYRNGATDITIETCDGYPVVTYR